jgi:RluA family pseudouridine synthase
MRPGALPPVLYEDAAVIAFDKPSGLAVAPDRWRKDMPYLMRLVHERLSPDCGNAHRLDRETSGAVLCAKTPEALRFLSRAFQQRQVEKVYLALTRSAPTDDRGTISAPLAHDRRRPGRMVVWTEGRAPSRPVKDALTEWEVAERFASGWALLRLHPRTGRTHQLRVHLAHIGCPVAGDALYGDARGLFLSKIKRGYRRKPEAERPLLGRLALHALSLGFLHPTSGEWTVVTAPEPKDFALALKYLRRGR